MDEDFYIAGYDDNGKLIKVWDTYNAIIEEYPNINKLTLYNNVYRHNKNRIIGLRLYKILPKDTPISVAIIKSDNRYQKTKNKQYCIVAYNDDGNLFKQWDYYSFFKKFSYIPRTTLYAHINRSTRNTTLKLRFRKYKIGDDIPKKINKANNPRGVHQHKYIAAYNDTGALLHVWDSPRSLYNFFTNVNEKTLENNIYSGHRNSLLKLRFKMYSSKEEIKNNIKKMSKTKIIKAYKRIKNSAHNKNKTIYYAAYRDDGEIFHIWNSKQEVFNYFSKINKGTLRNNLLHSSRNRMLKLRFKTYFAKEEIKKKIKKWTLKGKLYTKRIYQSGNKGYIYKIWNNINNKVYIGQTVNYERRKWDHFHFSENDDKFLYQKMRELGKKHFFMELVEECKIEDINEREKYWVSYYDSFNNGYNMTPGGDVCQIPGKEPIKLLAYYADTGEFYKEFSSVSNAVKEEGYKKSAISGITHILGRIDCQTHGFIWLRKENEDYPSKIKSLKDIREENKKNKINATLNYIKENIEKMSLEEIKKNIMSHSEDMLSWRSIYEYIRENAPILHQAVLQKNNIEKNRFFVIVNCKTKREKVVFSQLEAAQYLDTTQPNVSKVINGHANSYLIKKEFVIIPCDLYKLLIKEDRLEKFVDKQKRG